MIRVLNKIPINVKRVNATFERESDKRDYLESKNLKHAVGEGCSANSCSCEEEFEERCSGY